MAVMGRFLGFGGVLRAVLLLVNPPLAPPRRGMWHVDGWWGGWANARMVQENIFFAWGLCGGGEIVFLGTTII